MSRDDRIELHRARAVEELARARSAACPKAELAHLALSELHLDQLRALSFAPKTLHAFAALAG